jgi:(E)-4-hydroxy-3-methylbut-2-enyl-diphosphate synthase
MERRKTRQVFAGNVGIGSESPVSVQSMLNAPSHDIDANIIQALALKNAGCQIIRIAVPDTPAIKLIPALKKATDMPVVADIHYDYRLALEAVAAGIDKIRINPGNIGSDERVKAVADACRLKKVPIRIGVNSGSIEKHILEKYKHPTAEAMCESAMYHARMLEKFGFVDIVISLKSSNVVTMIDAYEKLSKMCDYPLHLGVTEAGTERLGIIKSAVGIGSLLAHGIGDTIRVSLTADPVREVHAAYDILRSLGLFNDGINIISCPTCGRTKIDVISLANKAEKLLLNCKKPLNIAIMGCAVNGPGEAKEADIGIAGGDKEGLIFKKGQILRKVPEEKLIEELLLEIENI